jgi:crotonobetainyl-CoA:carnitine CoA-transferase CaiB-like acyl-CoA transferase
MFTERISPLTDLQVLDLSLLLPGPFCTMLLRDLGATVIKVEPPTGDPLRNLDHHLYDQLNRGKSVIRIDLKNPSGQCVLREFVERADVMLEGFRPGVSRRLGIDFERMRKINPKLVYCSLSGYGQAGPLAGWPSHDINFAALSGLLSESSNAHREVGVPVVDLAGGSTAAVLILAALQVVSRNGEGLYIDATLFDCAIVWSQLRLHSNHTSPVTEPTYGVYQLVDGKSVACAILEDKMWKQLCEAFAWDDWSEHIGLASYSVRLSRAEEISKRLENNLLTMTLTDVMDLAQEFDLPITQVSNYRASRFIDQVEVRELFEEGKVRSPLPPKLCRDLKAFPKVVENAETLLCQHLGWTPARIQHAKENGIIG